jgi:hypothetical protein
MSESKQSRLSRRDVLAATGATGIAAAVAGVHPAAPQPGSAHNDAGSATHKSGGYLVSPHVLRYYQTARL